MTLISLGRAHLILLMALFFSLVVSVSTAGSSTASSNSAETEASDQYTLAEDVLWASPKGFDLTMDIYTPNSGKASYPVLVIFHGGGWLINDKSIMDEMSAYVVTHGEYVVCNVDYRLLADADNTVMLDEIIEDAFGSVLWVKEHIAQYKGDPARVAVTGDSAGAHLAAMVVNNGRQFNAIKNADPLNFKPSYLPAKNEAGVLGTENDLAVQAAILSYGLFDVYQSSVEGFEGWKNVFWLVGGVLPRGLFGPITQVHDHPSKYQAVSPWYTMPQASARALPPQLLTVGSDDPITTPAKVKAYAEKLRAAGHVAEYWEYEGQSHAYLDSGSTWILGKSFEADAPVALDVMIKFLDNVFYAKES